MFWRGADFPKGQDKLPSERPIVSERYVSPRVYNPGSGQSSLITPRVLFDQLSDTNLRRLLKDTQAELGKRAMSPAVITAFGNFMAGVTQAIAARSFLRWSKGHSPLGGTTPQSGEMWNAQDGGVAERMMAARLAVGLPGPTFNPLLQMATTTCTLLREQGWPKQT